ncbi:phage integrase N-terminal SAM-like domain-containing protein [Sorangium sp. So ce1099]|uniref:phage integrase N-terminal SAM-like domain-containing protein n=1 Tax=Sorangium sp. So ce1099 TaxID=3133331 RepID=UPI003F5FBF7E
MQSRVTIRCLHDAPRTEEAYVHWIRELIRFHDGECPRQTGAKKETASLDELAAARRTSTSAQNQALCAFLILHERALDSEIPRPEALEHARLQTPSPPLLMR